MTPEMIAEAVYAIGQAAETLKEAQLGGAELGKMLAAQLKAQEASRERTRSASALRLHQTLVRLTGSALSNHAAVADGALTTWLSVRGTGVRR